MEAETLFSLSPTDAQALTVLERSLVRSPGISVNEGAVAYSLTEPARDAGFDEVCHFRVGNFLGRHGCGSGGKQLMVSHTKTMASGERIRLSEMARVAGAYAKLAHGLLR